MNWDARKFRLGLLFVLLLAVCLAFFNSSKVSPNGRASESYPDPAIDGVVGEAVEAAPIPPGDKEMDSYPQPTPAVQRDLDRWTRVLPSAGADLIEQLPLLVEEAKRGNPVASCRLALSRVRCATELGRREFASRMRRGLEQGKMGDEDYWIDNLSTAEEYFSRLDGFCANVDQGMLPSVDEALEHSIFNLSPRQRTVLAMLRSDGQVRRLRSPVGYSEVGTYLISQTLAEKSYDFLLDGFRARDPLALEGLILVHAPGAAIPPQGVELRKPNPELFLRYALLYVGLYGVEAIGEPARRLAASALATLSDSDRQALREQVDIEIDAWRQFSPSSFSLPPLSSRDGVMDLMHLELCDR